jgi:membrane-associated phospholipid phosphatase
MQGKEGITPPSDRICSSRTWTLVTVLLVVCVVLTLLLRIKEMTDLDARLFLEIREQYETGLKSFLSIFTQLGLTPIWFLVLPLLWMARRKKEAASLLAALLMVLLLITFMRYVVDPFYHPIEPLFPSLHAMTIFAVTVSIGMNWRKTLIPMLVVSAAVSFGLVYIGVHYPYEAVSGAIMGILIGLIADSLNLTSMIQRVDKWIKRRSGPGMSRDSR